MSTNILEMKKITKIFPGVKALDEVDIAVEKGEIHFIVGENGAGKSTLMKVLSGVYSSGTFDGKIYFDNEYRKFSNLKNSQDSGIAIIHQELALFPNLTIYENLFIGNEIAKRGLINWEETKKSAEEVLKLVGLKTNIELKVSDLSVGKQQLIEIARALSKNIKLLILDEPTASLNDGDSENLLKLILDLKKRGITCIMISHKLKEVKKIADSITVIRDGKTIKRMKKEEITEEKIITNMVGREIGDIFPKREAKILDKKILEINNLSATNKEGKEILKDVSLHVNKGEIVGIAGLMGSSRTELAHTIFGNYKKYKVSGIIKVENKEVKLKNTKQAIKNKIMYVSEDRKGDGLILIDDIKKNITLSNLKKITKNLVVNTNEEFKISEKYRKDINIKTPSVEQKIGNLSGGNQQKVSISKALFTDPNILILDEPTRGIDVGAKNEIYTLMNELVDQGLSIIMISSELPEVIGMSDRIYVMAEGKLAGELNKKEFSQENIMKYATAA